jgi:hypothetical protein
VGYVRQRSGCLARRDVGGVSEILGVTMLLAMVVTVLGAVFVLLVPLVDDINDNREWAAGSVAATQLSDRILVVADSPAGTGVVHHSAQLANTIDWLPRAETWTIAADLAGTDRVIVQLDPGEVNVTSLNRTATNVTVVTETATYQFDLVNGTGNLSIGSATHGRVSIEVKDMHGNTIHRLERISIDGIRLNNQMSRGVFSVDLVNGARIEKLPGQGIEVRQYPRLRHDVLIDGTHRVSLVLLDIEVGETLTRHMTTVNIGSLGTEALFEAQSRNLLLKTEFYAEATIGARYTHHWAGDHDLWLASGQIDDYNGFGPRQRLSGLDGLTLFPADETFTLEVTLQKVVMS